MQKQGQGYSDGWGMILQRFTSARGCGLSYLSLRPMKEVVL